MFSLPGSGFYNAIKRIAGYSNIWFEGKPKIENMKHLPRIAAAYTNFIFIDWRRR